MNRRSPAFLSGENRNILIQTCLGNGTCQIPIIAMGSMGAIGRRSKLFYTTHIERPSAMAGTLGGLDETSP